MECIVHFEVKHKEGVKHLRGLVFVGKGETPDAEQLIGMFKDMHYNVILSDRDKLVFTPTDALASYSSIRVTSLDTGEQKYTEDRDLKKVLGNLMPQRPTGL
ncbi:hypothetical protein [Paenibacillus pini]|uniref:Uncharacterized protein n=1 Tax=Paenibacillus pini JCM 16418 TaxID=1236976 RepID=W7Z5C2_9BACL|nr:hypothetical protein [Paenibacillus pini]GAF09524.1 hypothetical protein JCM16418_3667 [Paenibacillus pini JCM 16418]